MSDRSPVLSLPYILPGQAQKHVTHNEALRQIDALVQLVLVATLATTPPPAPVEGEAHGLAAAPVGDWAGQGGKIAIRAGNGWDFVTPRTGWLAWDLVGGLLRIWNGTAWSPFAGAVDNLDGIGIGTAHDATNRLAVAAPATLLTHAGAGHQLKINKAAAGDTASLLYQNGWSGRAEMGLAGNDDFSVKVSADGALWTEALRIARATGMASGAAVQGHALDTSGPERLVRIDGALAAGLSAHGAYYDAAAGRNIDSSTAGDAGLYNDGNPGTWPLAPGGHFWWITTQRMFTAGAGACLQIATRYTGTGTPANQNRHFRIRANSGGAWGPWERVMTNRTLLGAVSQSGGVPTGAVIERGANANGSYTRLADGTQICTRSLLIKGSGDATAGVKSATWTFPAAFVDAGNVVPAGALLSSAPHSRTGPTFGFPSGTDVAVHYNEITGVAGDVSVRIQATGRWY